jgi:outer membrane autotransporter protein
VGGGSLRYETGSHVDVKGFSALVGAALAPEFSNGKMLFGVFMEGGKNDYDTYSFIPNYRDVDGKGDSTYFGAGLMFRYTLTGGAASGLYVEASTRFGKSRTKFHTLDILHNNDPASFNISTNYYGFHGGLGYVIPLGGNGLNLDLSAKLFYLHQQGANAIVHGDLVNFDNADSLRLLAGGRLNFRSAGIVRPYVGAYFNHEFKGDARATVNDRPIAAPTLKGSSGKAELGIVLHPSESIPIFLDLGVQGYFGRVRGVSGTASFRYNF